MNVSQMLMWSNSSYTTNGSYIGTYREWPKRQPKGPSFRQSSPGALPVIRGAGEEVCWWKAGRARYGSHTR